MRQIDFAYLYEHGVPASRDTLARQRRSDPTFTDPAQWKRFCQSASRVEGALAWGAFVGQRLAAYVIAFVIDGYSIFLYQMSLTATLPLRVNHALTFSATKEMLSLPFVHCVSEGHEPVRDLPGLDQYKVRLGFKKRPLRQVVRLHPLVKPLVLGPAGRFGLRGLQRLLPNSDLLKRAGGIVGLARCSYPVSSEDPVQVQVRAEGREAQP